jgi:hypothetical protein
VTLGVAPTEEEHMRRLTLAALSLAFLVTACQPATTELTEEQRAEIAAEVNAINAEAWEPWFAADVDGGMTYYPDSPELTYARDGQLFRGVAAVEDDARSTFASIASQDISFTESHTDVLAPTVVCINQLATFSVTDTAGVVGPERVFAGTYIWVKRNGEWKIQSSHESSFRTEAQ